MDEFPLGKRLPVIPDDIEVGDTVDPCRIEAEFPGHAGSCTELNHPRRKPDHSLVIAENVVRELRGHRILIVKANIECKIKVRHLVRHIVGHPFDGRRDVKVAKEFGELTAHADGLVLQTRRAFDNDEDGFGFFLSEENEGEAGGEKRKRSKATELSNHHGGQYSVFRTTPERITTDSIHTMKQTLCSDCTNLQYTRF